MQTLVLVAASPQSSKIKEGDTVIDLGSGAGNDAFIARRIVGETGKVIGIDITDAMIKKSRENAESLGLNNVEFRLGDIENMPITSNKADVIVSNCVLNLVPNKHKVMSEVYRVLKPGGHFSISDIVLDGELPEKEYKKGNVRIVSVTTYADKQAKDDRNCCEPNSGCC